MRRLRSSSRHWAVLLFVGGMATTGLAQSESPAAGADVAAEESAPSSGSDTVVTEEARAHFRAGVNFLQDPDGPRYEEAYQQFKLAYEESPSWKVLGNLGISAMYLERDGEAIDAFERYLAEGGSDLTPEERQQFDRDLQTLKAAVVTVTLTGSPGGVRIVDRRLTNRGGSITNVYEIPDSGSLTLRIRPGSHSLTAHLASYEDQVWDLSAKAAQSYAHSFEFAAPVEEAAVTPAAAATPADAGPERPVPTSVWIGAGVTGALLIGSVTTGILALDKNAQYQTANDSGDATAPDLRNEVQTLNVVTDVLIGATIASGAVTAVLYFTRPTVQAKTAFQLKPLIGPQVMALSVSGAF